MQTKRLYKLYVSKLHFYAKFPEEYKIICINTDYETKLVTADDNKLTYYVTVNHKTVFKNEILL
jgi:outer membrane lipoprotein-sorting protein